MSVNSKWSLQEALVLGFVGLLFFVLVSSPFVYWASETTNTVQVVDKWIKRGGGNSPDRYLVATNNGMFTIRDSLLYTTWNSSDKFAHLVEGEEYSITYIGWRVPFLSWYPTIVELESL